MHIIMHKYEHIFIFLNLAIPKKYNPPERGGCVGPGEQLTTPPGRAAILEF